MINNNETPPAKVKFYADDLCNQASVKKKIKIKEEKEKKIRAKTKDIFLKSKSCTPVTSNFQMAASLFEKDRRHTAAIIRLLVEYRFPTRDPHLSILFPT